MCHLLCGLLVIKHSAYASRYRNMVLKAELKKVEWWWVSRWISIWSGTVSILYCVVNPVLEEVELTLIQIQQNRYSPAETEKKIGKSEKKGNSVNKPIHQVIHTVKNQISIKYKISLYEFDILKMFILVGIILLYNIFNEHKWKHENKKITWKYISDAVLKQTHKIDSQTLTKHNF